MRRFFSSIRGRLLLLLFFAILPALALTLYTGLEARQTAAAAAQHDALQLAILASADQDVLIESTRQLLMGLARLSEVRQDDPSACSALFADLLKQYPLYINLGVARLNGDLWCSAVPPSSPTNYANRAWHSETIRTRDFVIGGYVVGYVTRKPLASFAYPVLDASGEAQAVVFAGLDLAWLNRFIAQIQLPSGSELTVIDGTGTILARSVEPENWVGKQADAPIVKIIMERKHQGTVEAIGLDGVNRLYAFTPLGSQPQTEHAYVFIGIPTAVAYAQADQTLTRNLIALGFVMVLALLAAWWGSDAMVLRGLRSLLSVTRRLAAGDLNVRTGVASEQNEIGHVARAFDEMADALQQRETQARHAEAELRASEERFRALAENAQDLVNILDADGTYRFASRSFERVLGYAPAELIGRNAFELIHPDDAPTMLQTIAEALGEPGATRHAEFRFRHHDGSWRLMESVGANLLHLPAIRGLVVNSHDITERKAAEEALSHSRDLLDLTGQMAQVGGWELDLEAQTLHWTAEVYRIHEVDPAVRPNLAEAINFYAPESQLAISAAVQAGIDAGTPWDLELQLITATGRRIWVRAQGATERRDSKTVRLYGAFQDITARKHAEAEIWRRVTELNALNAMATIVSESLDVDEILDRAIDEALRIVGVQAAAIYLLDEAAGELVMATHRGITAEFAAAARRFKLGEGMAGRAAQTGQPVVMARMAEEYPGALKAYIQQEQIRSGAVAPLIGRTGVLGTMKLAAASPQHFDAAGVELLVALGRQIAIGVEKARLYQATLKANEQLKTYAAQLERSNRELQEFAYVASHDLQEPLRKIQAFGDRLKIKYGDAFSAEGRDYLERMLNAAGRMSTMINDLLAYSRVTTKGQLFVAVDLNQVVREVVSDLETRIEETGGRVEFGALPTLNADPLQMRQLLQNLIGNALKFHREGVPPVVKVYAEVRGAECVEQSSASHDVSPSMLDICVEDNGIGFDEKYLDRIFTPFQRLHARDEYEGSGIGLAICRKIAERHGGAITARSTPGQGATFIV